MIEKFYSRSVFEVAKSKSARNTLCLIDIDKCKKVQETFIQGHKYDFVTISNVLFHNFKSFHVNMQTLKGAPHVLVEKVSQCPHSS